MTAADPLHLNRAQTARLMGVPPTTLDRWTAKGCPVVKRAGKGNAATFDAAAVVAWYVAERERGGSEAEARRRKLNADAERAELEVAKARREVAPVADMLAVWLRATALIRANVMGVAQRAAVRLLGESDEGRIKTVLREELRAALASGANAIEAWADEGAADEPPDFTTIAQGGDDE